MVMPTKVAFQLPDDCAEVIRDRLKLTDFQFEALDSVLSNPRLRFEEDEHDGRWSTKLVQKDTGIHHWATWNALQALQSKGLVRQVKEGRDAYWMPVMPAIQAAYEMPEQLGLF